MSMRMNTAAGACEPANVELIEPIVRNIIDMVTRQVNEKSQNVKNARASRRRLLKKYTGMLKNTEVRNLLGRSQIIAAMASANGWKNAYL